MALLKNYTVPDIGKGRKVIFHCITGSHLYGTATEDSDIDAFGVFLPCPNDLVGFETGPKEFRLGEKKSKGLRNTKGDIDNTLFSLRTFLRLASEGQSMAIEMLFVPDALVLHQTDEWRELKEILPDQVLSKQSLSPFLGFAVAQANKSELKGKNLNLVKNLQIACKLIRQQPGGGNSKLPAHFVDETDNDITFHSDIVVEKALSDNGKTVCLSVAGRLFDMNVKVKQFSEALHKMESRYGTRSKDAAQKGVDNKSLSHAYRLIGESIELLQTGKLTFPRPDSEFLLEIKNGKYSTDFRNEISEEVTRVSQEVRSTSPLMDKPNMDSIKAICFHFHANAIVINMVCDERALGIDAK